MKAVVLKGFGGVENLVKTDVQRPVIKNDEVLVDVKAISINPVDIKTRTGKGLAGRLKDYDPIILGWDISGIVIKTGASVNFFHNGDEVFGMINFPGHGKAYAEYVAVPASHLALKPPNISHEEAAAASLAGMTAWQILSEKMQIKPGQNILIHSSAGGVGHFAVQMAKYMGAEVTGTASEANRDFVLGLGASRHIDYQLQKFENVICNMDFVLDTIGGEYIDRSLKVLKPGGTIVSIPSDSSGNVEEKASACGRNGSRFLVKSNGNNMNEISDLLKNKAIKSYISARYSFDDIQAAHLQIGTGKTKGKIVVILQK